MKSLGMPGGYGYSRKYQEGNRVLAAQKQAICINAIKIYMDKSQEQSECRIYGERDETVKHLVNECSKLKQREYKPNHDLAGMRVHWEVCRMYGIEVRYQWYEHAAVPVAENDMCTILWDFNIQIGYVIQARRPDMIVINLKYNTAQAIEFAISHYSRLDSKESEKIEKYQHPIRGLKTLQDMKMVVIHIVI